MTRRTLLLLDTSMLSFFAVLMSWRFTGVALHEWIGVALIALILFHLLVHWAWVESRVAMAFVASTNRRYGALLLNTALFAAMGATLVSGLVISKVVIRNRLTPESYLHWHGLHESASTFTVIVLGLHLAFNWDRIVGAFRRAFAKRAARAPSSLALSPKLAMRRIGWILGASFVLTAIVWEAVRVTPHDDKVMFIHADGTRELAAPPPEITKVRPQTIRPAPAQGAPRLVASLVLLGVAGLIGRQLLTFGRQRRRRTARGLRGGVAARLAPNDPG